VLFRGGAEGTIRRKLIEENLLEAVIGLPEKLFYGTSIPAAIMVFNKERKPWGRADTGRDQHVLFIDASEDYADGTRQNTLREKDIEKILRTFEAFEEVEKYAYPATLEELKENDFNLNIPRYVDTFEEKEDIDIPAVQEEIEELEAELAETQAKMRKYLEELGLSK
jgi:type I restriction enzyme M protein